MIRVTKRHMVGGQRHEHIAEVEWTNLETGATGNSTREVMVAWLDKSDANQAIVGDYPRLYAYVGTGHPDRSAAYIRTYADGKWNDNLLALSEH